MIIITTKEETFFINEKNYDKVTHYINKGTALCDRRDSIVEISNVIGVVYVPDGDNHRYESGFICREENV